MIAESSTGRKQGRGTREMYLGRHMPAKSGRADGESLAALDDAADLLCGLGLQIHSLHSHACRQL